MTNDEIKNIILKSPHCQSLSDLVIGENYTYFAFFPLTVKLIDIGFIEEEGWNGAVERFFYLDLLEEKDNTDFTVGFTMKTEDEYYKYENMWELKNL